MHHGKLAVVNDDLEEAMCIFAAAFSHYHYVDCLRRDGYFPYLRRRTKAGFCTGLLILVLGRINSRLFRMGKTIYWMLSHESDAFLHGSLVNAKRAGGGFSDGYVLLHSLLRVY